MAETRNKPRTRQFNMVMSEEEYEACFQAAAMADKSASAWARDILISNALRARWRGQAA